MLLELARPVILLLSILSLYGVFHAAFLTPATTVDERLGHALLRLVLAAVISLAGGLLFRAHAHRQIPITQEQLAATLPMQLFCWATVIMALLFAVSWYLESFCILYRDSR